MFTEILRVKPVLDKAGAAQMELALSTRFNRVAKRFGGGLMKVIKGSIFGISLGLLNRLLNPIEALEEKIKNLMGQGETIQEAAERFGTTPGQLKRLQDVASSLGVKPDQLNDMMTKYAEAINTARRELADPTQERSESTRAVEKFVGEKDVAEGFFKFVQSLRAEGQGQGRKQFFGDQGQFSRQLSGEQSRKEFERAVFGEEQLGAQGRLIQSDLGSRLTQLNEPSSQQLNQRFEKLAGLADQQRLLETQRLTKDFITTADQVNSKFIVAMEKAQAMEDARATAQLKSYEDLRKAANGIDELKGGLDKLMAEVSKGFGLLGELLTTMKASPLFRGIFGR